MITLRDYRAEDLKSLLQIDQACFVEGIAYSEREMRHFLNRPRAVRIVADEKGSVEGFVIAHRFRPRRAQHCLGHIITIDVMPKVRRKGLGSQLLQAVEGKLREAGCDYVSLETAVDNLAAMHFYKKHGYTVLKVLPNYYLDSIDALLMGKKL